MAEGKALCAAGAFDRATKEFKQAVDIYQRLGAREQALGATLELGKTYHALGQMTDAIDLLVAARRDADADGDSHRLLRIDAALGAAYTLSARSKELAAEVLEQSLASARELQDRAAEALILNNLANLRASQQKYGEAIAGYTECVAAALEVDDALLCAKACANLAAAAATSGDFPKAKQYVAKAEEKSRGLAASHELAYLAINVGKTHERLATQDNRERLRALEAYRKAGALAAEIGDRQAASHALGRQGQLYETERKYEDALRLTRQAAFLAQAAHSPDALYRWEWQTGRILRARGDLAPALAAYRRAVESLQSIRHDVAIRYGNPNAGSSFREMVGPLFFEMTDLLLKISGTAKGREEVQTILKEAVGTVELLKAAELEDYFQGDCVNLRRSKTKDVEKISASAAVIYIIPLGDHTEIVVSTKSGFKRITAKPGADELTRTVRMFRYHLEKRTTEEYLEEAWQLYAWLIQPIEPLLAADAIDTLVFVPDGALRTVPMAALHNRKKFLVEKYSIAVSPGIQLMDARPIAKTDATLMINALTKGVQGFAPLGFVGEEIRNVRQIYAGPSLIDSDFTALKVGKEFAQHEYPIVHFASHGHFDRDASNSYILTFDGRIKLDELEVLLRPSALRDKPVELLTLSACETAAGDDRAALGLAGVAVKAGARSAMATLWYVNDEASSNLVSSFYAQLKKDPNVSKARALSIAQTELIKGQLYSHPCYWAPYLMIGNWL